MILFTDGAGFIGSNFLLDWLAQSVACPKEIAWRSGWLKASQLEALAQPLTKNGYGRHLLRILKENVY